MACEAIVFIAITVTFVIFVLALNRMKSILEEHSSSGLNHSISLLHFFMILMFALGKFASQAAEIYLWFKLIFNGNDTESEVLLSSWYSIRILITAIFGTFSTMILIYMLRRFIVI